MTEKTAKTSPAPQQSETLAVLSVVFGIVSLLGPGLLMGIPAIILASIALKRDAPGRGLSIAGLVTGIISTVLSLLLIAFVVLVFVFIASHPDAFYYSDGYYYPAY